MLLRLPKPLNLKNSGKERGEMSVGLLLAWCDGGGSWGPWSWVGVGMGHYVMVQSGDSPVTQHISSLSPHDITVAWGVRDAAQVICQDPGRSVLVSQGENVPHALANLVAVFHHCSCRGGERNTQPW